MLFNYHPRFQIWGKDYVRPNLAGCARAEPFKRRKKMSTAKVCRRACSWRSWRCSTAHSLLIRAACIQTLRSAEPVGVGASTAEDEPIEHRHKKDLKRFCVPTAPHTHPFG